MIRHPVTANGYLYVRSTKTTTPAGPVYAETLVTADSYLAARARHGQETDHAVQVTVRPATWHDYQRITARTQEDQ